MAQVPRFQCELVTPEFEGIELGDARLNRRLLRVIEQVAAAPGASFPQQMRSTADREALYRFLANPKVTLDGVLQGHVEQTVARVAAESDAVRIVHDTSSFEFEGERDGLGIVAGSVHGFYGHFALAVGAGESRRPLGIVGLRPHIHFETEKRRGKSKSEQVEYTRALPREEKESSRWEKLAEVVSRRLPPETAVIHVMDQEADDFALFARLKARKLRFVIRASPERMTAVEKKSIEEVMQARPASLFRSVKLNPRSLKKQRGSRHPARNEREARLSIRFGPVVLRRPRFTPSDVEELHLNSVSVFEPHPPRGAEPIAWLLLTTEPIETLSDATKVVDHYRARWRIEEYFKALKTGCAFEKRQLTTYDALLRALGLFVPMAWRLLALRELANETEPVPAEALFDKEQQRLLRTLLSHRRADHQLAKRPTVRDLFLAIAALGGHIKNNGDPGWLVLGRGLSVFTDAEQIWFAARCDQS
jgi:Transposase DNA-binding/Transposase DDE domain